MSLDKNTSPRIDEDGCFCFAYFYYFVKQPNNLTVAFYLKNILKLEYMLLEIIKLFV